MSAALGQSIVVENKPGANGVIGAQAAASAPADGYTLLFTAGAELMAVKYMVKNPPFQPAAFTPITAAMAPLLFYVMRPGLPARSLSELLDYARARPGQLTYGSSGAGSPFHLIGEAINRLAGVKITHVPYKGTLQAIQDVLGGQIDISFGSLAGIGQYFRNGQLRPLACAGTRRAPQLPDVPALT
jgi:tripartite-type tricarboxylate transporter receptor subunit TctC